MSHDIEERSEKELFTLEELKSSLPRKKSISSGVLKRVNDIIKNTDEHLNYRENFLSYTNVLQKGTYQLDKYILAVLYVSHRCSNRTQKESFKLTFPERYAEMERECPDQISSNVYSYNNNKMVMQLQEQVMTPINILNRDMLQKTLNNMYKISVTSKSDIAKVQAGKAILTWFSDANRACEGVLKIDIGQSASDELAQLIRESSKLATIQQSVIADRLKTAKEIGASNIIDITEDDNN